jgi:hypothetical protein
LNFDQKSGAEAGQSLDAAARFGLARETKAKPAENISDKCEQAVNYRALRLLCLTMA